MSNKLGIINDINKALDTTVSKLEMVNKEVITISQSTRQAVGGFNNISLPKDLEANSKAAQKAIDDLTRALEDQRQETLRLEQQVQALQRRRNNAARRGIQQRVAETALRKELRIQARAVTDLGSAYDNLAAQNNRLVRERQNLAIRQRINNDLTEQEIQRLNELTNTIQRNQQILTETDQEIGNFRRNVGNYASGWDGLGNSINQLTRELPAAAVGFETFILAISNNFGQLSDEITKVVNQNKELAAQGKETQSVLKQLGKAVFTFQTFLFIGIGLFTIYSKEIKNFVVALFSSEKQLDATTAAQEALNQAQIEGAKSAASQISQTKLLFEVAQDVTRSTEEREKAVDELIDSSEGLIKKTERQNILNGEALASEERLINALIQRATLTAALALTGDNFSKILENRLKIQEKSNKLIELGVLRGKTQEEQEENLTKLIETRRKAEEKSTSSSIDRLAAQTDGIKVLDDIIESTDEINDLQEKNNAILSEALKISNSFTLGLTKGNTDAIKAIKGSIAFLEQQISKLEEQRNKLATTSKQWREYTDLIEDANVALAKLRFNLAGIDLQPVGDQLQSETQRIRESLNNILAEFDAEDIFSKETDILKEELDKQLKAREDAAKKQARILRDSLRLQRGLREDFTLSTIDAINSVFDAQIQRYDEQIQANSDFFEAILENEELSDDQRASLEQQRDEREEQIREKQKAEERKAFLFNQGLALAEIGLNLAKTITAINLAAAAQDAITPFAFGATGAAFRAANIPFAIATAAAQTATVLAQTLPAFEKGKNFNNNYEGLGIWGERRRELKISKDGSIEMSPRQIGNHLTYVKKDDVIIPDAHRYINSIQDDDLRNNLNRHVYNANMQHQNALASRALTKNSIMIDRLDSLNTTMQKVANKKTRFNLNQNIDIGKQLRFLERKRRTL